MKHIFIICLMAMSLFAIAGERVIEHADRGTPKIVFEPEFSARQFKGSDLATAYLTQNWRRYKFDVQASNLERYRVQESQLGTHYYFRQMIDGVPVEGANVVVSIHRESGRIFRVVNRSYPVEKTMPDREPIVLGPMDALHVTWDHLRGHGELLVPPNAEMVWIRKDNQFKLIWRVQMTGDGPSGAWRVAVDALDGQVLEAKDIRRYNKPRTETDFSDWQGPIGDLEAAIARVEKRLKDRNNKSASLKRADGRGVVFDPDPRTTLMDDTLQDSDPPEVFEDAYFERELRDITFDEEAGVYRLLGPWVEVRAIEASGFEPDTPVTETTDGFWDFRRQEGGFNDTMTYYHLDSSQRYMQALGFTGDTGIQEGPIWADADGFSGADNSFFDPSMNAMAFGHGCVDDNEDADVILHEYGHAIQSSIDFSWNSNSNGDSGGIGEGFADYWAGSHSIKTENGLRFQPNRIFSWDGHGTPSLCWFGRFMNKTEAQYDPNITYTAHQYFFQGDFESDELWSTPMFQALLTLYNQGIPMSEVDRIVLEAHFGFPGPIRMDNFAAANIQAAELLYPNGPHAQIFRENFARHNMVDHVASYTYYAAHVPPSGASWSNEIQLANPNDAAISVTATVYEDNGGAIATSSNTFNIPANGTSVFTPSGSAQRWVRFESDQPLSGTNFFFRDLGGERGQERAGVPLSAFADTAPSLIFPHVPANRTRFWSGAVLVNPGDSSVNLSIQLIGDAGTDLSNLLDPAVPTQLAAGQKWVTFLAPGPGGAAGIFNDDASAEKVSYVKVTAGGSVAGFQLYGYQTEAAATAGILATPDQARTHYPIRMALTDQEWTGFSLLNPSDDAAQLDVQALDAAGNVLQEATVTAGARTKLLGLNTINDGFIFPSNGTPVITIPDGSQVQTLLVIDRDEVRTHGIEQPLRVFELGGDLTNTKLDGGAVLGLADRAVFVNPVGELELFKAEIPGEVTLTIRKDGAVTTEILALSANQVLRQTFTAGQADSIEISGGLFTASLINDDADRLAIVNAKTVELSTK